MVTTRMRRGTADNVSDVRRRLDPAVPQNPNRRQDSGVPTTRRKRACRTWPGASTARAEHPASPTASAPPAPTAGTYERAGGHPSPAGGSAARRGAKTPALRDDGPHRSGHRGHCRNTAKGVGVDIARGGCQRPARSCRWSPPTRSSSSSRVKGCVVGPPRIDGPAAHPETAVEHLHPGDGPAGVTEVPTSHHKPPRISVGSPPSGPAASDSLTGSPDA